MTELLIIGGLVVACLALITWWVLGSEPDSYPPLRPAVCPSCGGRATLFVRAGALVCSECAEEAAHD